MANIIKNIFLSAVIIAACSVPIRSYAAEHDLSYRSVDLNSEFLDTPEFFWRNPNLEEFYILIKKFLVYLVFLIQTKKSQFFWAELESLIDLIFC